MMRGTNKNNGGSNDDNAVKAVVALIDPELAPSFALNNSSSSKCKRVQLPDPGDPSIQRTYLVTPEKTICELQSLAPTSGYGSFFVNGSHVVGSGGGGNLLTVTAVDPLFWFLLANTENATAETTNISTDNDTTAQQQWQPLEQIVSNNPHSLASAVVQALTTDTAQLQHLYQTMAALPGGDSSEYYYKFSMKKALQWLSQKQERVQAVLWQQEESAAAAAVAASTHCDNSDSANNAGSGTGAFSSSFHLSADLQQETKSQTASAGEDPLSDGNAVGDTRKQLQRQCREESVQIVCAYLGPAWSTRFLQHLQLRETVLLSPKQRQTAAAAQQQQQRQSNKSDNNNGTDSTSTLLQSSSTGMPSVTAAVDWNDVNKPVAKKAKMAPAVTMGAKKLAKVNVKGMKKMSAFFGAPKKKENKKP